MENIPNAQTQSIENSTPSFDNLYDNNLVHSIEKFDLERRKLHRFMGFALLGTIALSVILFLFVRHVENPGSVILTSFLLFFIVMIVSSFIMPEGRPPGYKGALLTGYFLLLFAASLLLGYLDKQGFTIGTLFVSTFMISISLGVFLIVLSKRALHYTHQYQELVLTPLVEHTVANARYMPQQKISEQTFMDSEILQKPFRKYDGYDLIEGKHKHINFEFSNVMMKTKGGKNSKQHQYIFLTGNLNKTLSGTTTIEDNKFSGLGKVGKFMSNITNMNSFPIETDKPEFEKYFKVYSTYPEESKGLLTPAFMDQLIRIANELKHPKSPKTPILFFKLKLENQKLYMAFSFNGGNSPNIFLTPRMVGKVDQRKVLQKNYDRLGIIMSMIDDLYQTDVEWTS